MAYYSNHVIYSPPSEQVIGGATITSDVPVDASYPLSNLWDGVPAKPCRFYYYGSIYFDFGAAQRIDVMAIIHHSIVSGATVTFEGNATSDFTSPAFKATIPIAAPTLDGYPVNAMKLLGNEPGYTVNGFRYWALRFWTNNYPKLISIGELWLGRTFVVLDPNVQWDVVQEHGRKFIEHSTDFGVSNIYDLGVTTRQIKMNLANTPDTQKQKMLDLWRSCSGRVKPFLLMPDGSVNDAWFARFTDAKQPFTENFLDQTTFDLSFDEVSRGLTPW